MVSLKSWIAAAAGLPMLLLAGCDRASANTDPAKPTAEMATNGAVHYENYCQPCHGENGEGNAEIGAPSIAGLPYWYVTRQLDNFREGRRGVAYDDIAGKRMRPMAWAVPTELEVREVSAWVAGTKNDAGQTIGLQPVKSLGTMAFTSKQVDDGKAAYGACAACHGAKAEGNETLGAPRLANLPDWYLVQQLRNFQHGIRGTSPGDTYGATMSPMAGTLIQKKDGVVVADHTEDVVAYIQTLK